MIEKFIKDARASSLLRRLKRGERVQTAEGLWGSSPALLASAVYSVLGRSVLLVSAGIDDAEAFYEECAGFLQGAGAGFLPASDAGGFDCSSSRLRTISRLVCSGPQLISAPVQALMQKLLRSENIQAGSFEVRRGEALRIGGIIRELTDSGYARTSEVQAPGEFAVRGGIVDVFPIQDELPSRLEFDSDRIESVRRFDPRGQLSVARASGVKIFSVRASGRKEDVFFPLLPADTVVLLFDPPGIICKAEETNFFQAEISGGAGGGHYIGAGELLKNLSAFQSVNMFPFDAPDENDSVKKTKFNVVSLDSIAPGGAAASAASTLREQGYGVFIFSAKNRDEPLSRGAGGGAERVPGWIRDGFALPSAGIAFLTEDSRRLPSISFGPGRGAADRTDIEAGDYVVHINHGVGIYRGLKTLETDGREGEFLEIEYLDRDRLYIPPSQIHLVSKYAGVEGHSPPVSRLGGSVWKKTREKAEKSIRDLAGELLGLSASRETGEGFAFSADSDWQRDFENRFPHKETRGQAEAVYEIKKDMESEKPMDRIVCGDSGYGKTEVAVRAAFKCVMDGKQAAVLVPTTVLAQQHFRTFTERVSGYPVNTAVLNRFQSPAGQAEIVLGLKSGSIDIVIGTHRLLQKDIAFKDLGLVIIDEEQRFGVAQKEKLKKMRSLVDVLSMTATPIPRTLYMSLVGIRDISIIETPPGMRLPVEGRVVPFSKKLIRFAVLRELQRNCQVFYLHNRVQTIQNAAAMLSELVPEARIGIAHGQMDDRDLEKVMNSFTDYKIDVLVCTTIIESGIDIQRANTIIIDRADAFGLADLYQLKGRVGRWSRQGHAFFMMPGAGLKASDSQKRLKAVQELAGPGSGFNTAMRDLELRGAGNLLGHQQHGHIAAVGFDLYCRLLRRAAAELNGEALTGEQTVLELGFEPYIPQSYVPGLKARVNIYRRISGVSSVDEITGLEAELTDRFGEPPLAVRRMFKTCILKLKAEEKGVAYAGVEGRVLKIKFHNGAVAEEQLDPYAEGDGVLRILEEKICM